MEVSGTAEWLWLDRVSYKPVFLRLLVYGRAVEPFYVSLRGLGVSLGGFFEKGIIQGGISYQAF